MTTPHLKKSISRSPSRLALLLIPLVLACFGLSPTVRAADETRFNANTGEGNGALQSVSTGSNNTGLGAGALFSLTTGKQNTATGAQALNVNTADGNTADGFQALVKNTIGEGNTASGWRALFQNTDGNANTAMGHAALYGNSTGLANTAMGFAALEDATDGIGNTAMGSGALGNLESGVSNTAMGSGALASLRFGFFNTALGSAAGANLTGGTWNIDIGRNVFGEPGDNFVTRIGISDPTNSFVQHACFIGGIVNAPLTGTTVVVSATGQLGIAAASSARFKTEIKPMDKASEGILALKPVTFRYKQEIDPVRSPQFGLLAEEVAKINPDLVTRDAKGELYTVRYDAVNAMLLNEFLKEHQTVQELKSAAAKQGAVIASQQKQIEALTAGLQKVSAQVEMSRPAPQTVANNQ